ncbi:hypothetical protein CHS0354_009705 [Potamilus streckersoni]|uniref:Mitochondria-eating protein C-terminal domain-containing protein n=1 Tax=Potamilus streckersoni TaxID=2493646 RepID=A0AAE0VM13_9BIVA|nr:hypothetical protein CHS0354_009705 [Potamilus streckersoni]
MCCINWKSLRDYCQRNMEGIIRSYPNTSDRFGNVWNRQNLNQMFVKIPDRKTGTATLGAHWQTGISSSGEIRRITLENQHLRKCLDDLYKNVLGREELKTKDIQNYQSILELETYTQQVIQTFHDTRTEAEYSYQLLEELSKFSTYGSKMETELALRQPPTQTRTSSKDRKNDKKLNTLNEEPPSSRHVEQLQKCFANASNILKKKMEAEHTVKRLEEINKRCLDRVQLESEADGSEQGKQVSSAACKNRLKDQKGNEKVMKTPVSIHFEQINRDLASTSNTMKKHIDTELAERERNYLLSMLEVLLRHAEELYEDKAQGDILSSLDQIESSINQESKVYLGLMHVKEISAIHRKWKSASEKLKKEWEYLLSILDALHQDTHHISERKSHNLKSSILDQIASSIDEGKFSYQMVRKANEIASIQMELESDFKSTVQERNYFLSMLEILLQHVQELYEGKAQGDILSFLDQIESSVDQESTVYIGLGHVREIIAIHRKWKSASETLKIEWEFCVSVLDALHHKTKYTEENSHNIKSSVLDQLTSSIDKESSVYEIFNKAKEISNYQMELEREAEYVSQLLEELSQHYTDDGKLKTDFVLRMPPTPMTNDSSKDRKLNKKGNTRNEEPPRSRHIAQLQRGFAGASNILKKQMEDRYAARLLEELGNFSNVAKRYSTGTILTHPPTDSSHTVDVKPINGIDSSGRNTHPSVKNEICRIHYVNASHILEQIKDKEELRVELVRNANLLEEMTKTHEQLKQQNSQLVQQADSLRMRLSELAGAKLTHDNASIADLSDANRPTKLADMYSELYDNQWTDALENLSKQNPEECEETLICCLYNILIGIHNIKVNEILAKHLSEAAKLSSNVASANIVKAFVNNANMKKRNRKAMKACKIYIEECVKLCWHMHVQTPPVCIDLKAAKGKVFARDVYREYKTKGAKLAFVVWPALFLHKTGPLLPKGVAQGE